MKNYDVVVVGAGTAGCIAAIQSARTGAKTLLIEKNGSPGGTATVGGVDFPGLFHAWGKQIISGVGWEMVKKCVVESNGKFPDFSDYKQPHWKLQIPINPYLYECLLEEEFVNSKVEVLYHTIPFEAKEEDNGVRLILCGKTGKTEIYAKKVIDATGDANIVTLAGYDVLFNSEKQPATLMFLMSGYNIEELNLEIINLEYNKAVEAGTMLHTDTGMSGVMSSLLNLHGKNAIHVPIENAIDSQSKSLVEQMSRLTVLRIYRFLKQFNGFENLNIEWMAQECGIRETAVINGMERISVSDYTSGRRLDDSVCFSFYPIDLHLNTTEGLNCRPLSEGVVPSIPLRALIPAESRHIIVAGRCVSSDQLANSALRVQASCMAMGQVASCAVVSAIEDDTDISEVKIDKIKELLLSQNAIVP